MRLHHRKPGSALTKPKAKRQRQRWNMEQYFQRAKTDLGLDHYEGRSWRGFHHLPSLSWF